MYAQVVGQGLQAVAGLHLLTHLLVLLLELLGLTHHAVDLVLGQGATVVGDGDLLTLAGALVVCTDLQDAVLRGMVAIMGILKTFHAFTSVLKQYTTIWSLRKRSACLECTRQHLLPQALLHFSLYWSK